MKKSEAIRQIEALHIPYMELINGQCSPEATRRSMSEAHFACATPRFGGEIIVNSIDPARIDALEAQGWEIVRIPTRGFASLRGFDPEDEDPRGERP